MLSAERVLTAKDQRAVRLRAAAPTDVPGIVALERAVVAAGEGVVKTPNDVQDQRAAELLSDRIGTGHWVVAEWADDAGRIIGCCRLDQHRPSLIRHVATLSLEVHPDAQGAGIGRLLIECALDGARTAGSGPSDAVRRIELFVRADNARARRLYESVGFQIEGVRRDFVRLPDGRFVDDLMMALLIQRP
jgi:RimJ/RimL family protein N-acetyltransferase